MNKNKKNFANPFRRLKDMIKNVMHIALETVTKTMPFYKAAAAYPALICDQVNINYCKIRLNLLIAVNIPGNFPNLNA